LKCILCCLNQIHVFDSEEDSTNDSTFTGRVLTAVKKRSENCKGGRKKRESVRACSATQVVCDFSSLDNSTGTVLETQNHLDAKDSTNVLVDASIDCISAEPLECKDFTFSHQSDVDKILITDNIDNCGQFSSSRRILKEVKLFCPDIKLEFAYSLSKGGIALHTTSKEDRDRLFNELPAESFGGGIKHYPKGYGNTTQDSFVLFIKGIDTSVDVYDLQEDFGKQGIVIQEIRRLTKRHTGKPTQVVKVKCCEHTSQLLINSDIVINKKRCCVEKERVVRVIRCYNCQSFGHLARYCRGVRHCEFCGDSHGEHYRCSGDVQCCNCSGNHPASSVKCPVYRKRYESLTVQYPKRQHFHTALEANSTQVEC